MIAFTYIVNIDNFTYLWPTYFKTYFIVPTLADPTDVVLSKILQKKHS